MFLRFLFMKYAALLFLACLFLIPESIAQELPENENDTLIVWTPGRKLRWSDFQRSSHEGTKGAQSDIGLSIMTRMTDGDVEYVVYPYFLKKQSSTNTSDSYVLSHEQLHFDIAEIYARKMRKRLEQLGREPYKRQRYNREIDQLYQAYLNEQEYYDQKTGHSLVPENQRVWERKIAAELRELWAYRSKIFVD